MKAIINGNVLWNGEEIKGHALLFTDTIVGLVAENEVPAGSEMIDALGKYVTPGLIDLHIHGYRGEDTSDGDLNGLRDVAKGLLENGVTSFLPTTMTVSWPEIEAALNSVRALKRESEAMGFEGAQVLGAHAEGPFINPKRKGAQSDKAILPPDAAAVLKHKDIIRILTMAPEMQGGLEMIREVTAKSDIVVSIGHTDANYQMALAAVEAGASYITHLFNAMTGLNHRDPGVVGVGLTRDVHTELIADAFHVHPGLFAFLYTAKQDKLILVTDCTRAGGLGDGEYTLGGQPIFVKGIECRLADGTIAGSVLKLNMAVKNLRDHAGLSISQAIQAASLAPAQAIGQDARKGSLAPGKDADLVLFDHDMIAHEVFIRGNRKYKRNEA